MERKIILDFFKVSHNLTGKIFFASSPRYKETTEICNIPELTCFANTIEILSENIFRALNEPSDHYHPNNVCFNFPEIGTGETFISLNGVVSRGGLSSNEKLDFQAIYKKMCTI